MAQPTKRDSEAHLIDLSPSEIADEASPSSPCNTTDSPDDGLLDLDDTGSSNPNDQPSNHGSKNKVKENTIGNNEEIVWTRPSEPRDLSLEHFKDMNGNTGPPNEEGEPPLTDAQRQQLAHIYRLYLSHFLSTWGDRMWAFAIALFLIAIWEDSLILTAGFGLATTLTVVLFGALVGHYVDTSERLKTVRNGLLIQNLSVVVCAVCIVILLKRSDHDWLFWVLVLILFVFGCLSTIGSLMGEIAVEKDWVVVITAGDSQLLAITNARMRRIDLTCEILAPLFVGVVMTYAGVLTGAVCIAIWNVASVFAEYFLLLWVYRSFPALKEKKKSDEEEKISMMRRIFVQFLTLRDGWKTYVKQDIVRPGISLALLYCTVLSFHAIMTGFAYWRGISEAALGGFRGAGSLFGISSTFVFPRLHPYLGLVKTGMLSIWLQWVCLLLSFLSVVVVSSADGDCGDLPSIQYDCCINERNTQMAMLLAGVIMSRFGLWMFDLSVNQMMQEYVSEDVLGTVSGVQGSISNILELLSFVFSMIFAKPEDFNVLVIFSFSFVTGAALLYSTYFMWPNHKSQ